MEVWAAEATPRAQLLVDLLDQVASVLQLALVVSVVVVVVLAEDFPDAEVAVAVVAASAVIVEAFEEGSAVIAGEDEVAVALVVVEEVSVTSPTAMDLRMALLLGPAVHEEAVSVVIVAAEADLAAAIEVVEEVATKTGAVVVAEATTAARAEQTMNLSVAETDTATVGMAVVEAVAMVVETVVETAVEMAAATNHGNVGMKVTATTIHGNEGGTRPRLNGLSVLRRGLSKVYISLSSPHHHLFSSMRVRTIFGFAQLLTSTRHDSIEV